MQKVLRIVLYIMSGIVGMFGVGAMAVISIPSGLVFLAAALLIAPAVMQKISALTGRAWISPAAAVFMVLVAGPIVLALTAPSSEEVVARYEQQAAISAKKEAERQKKEDIDRVNAEAKAAEEKLAKIAEYMAQIDREISSIPTIKASSYTKDVQSINVALIVLGAWAVVYENGESLDLSEAQEKKRQEFRRLVVKKQTELLPVLRDAYGPAMRRQLWEADGSAKTFGAGFKTVEFVSAAFVRNANIKQINGQIHENLIMLRFNQVRYKWFSEASEYTYYDLNSPKDSEVVRWENGREFTVLK